MFIFTQKLFVTPRYNHFIPLAFNLNLYHIYGGQEKYKDIHNGNYYIRGIQALIFYILIVLFIHYLLYPIYKFIVLIHVISSKFFTLIMALICWVESLVFTHFSESPNIFFPYWLLNKQNESEWQKYKRQGSVGQACHRWPLASLKQQQFAAINQARGGRSMQARQIGSQGCAGNTRQRCNTALQPTALAQRLSAQWRAPLLGQQN